jgi:hypothetical protein
VAERAVAAARERISSVRLRRALNRLDARGADALQRLALARERIANAMLG